MQEEITPSQGLRGVAKMVKKLINKDCVQTELFLSREQSWLGHASYVNMHNCFQEHPWWHQGRKPAESGLVRSRCGKHGREWTTSQNHPSTCDDPPPPTVSKVSQTKNSSVRVQTAILHL